MSPSPPGPGTVKSDVTCRQDLGLCGDQEGIPAAGRQQHFHQTESSKALKDLSFQVLATDPLLRVGASGKTPLCWVLGHGLFLISKCCLVRDHTSPRPGWVQTPGRRHAGREGMAVFMHPPARAS